MSKKLDKKLWEIFSEYIRRRDAYKFSESFFMKCITCNHVDHWKYFDAGHFISRRHKNTKFNEQNVNGQCKGCNGLKSGMQYLHGKRINEKYKNPDLSDILLQESRKTARWTGWDYEVRINLYKGKVKELKKLMGG